MGSNPTNSDKILWLSKDFNFLKKLMVHQPHWLAHVWHLNVHVCMMSNIYNLLMGFHKHLTLNLNVVNNDIVPNAMHP